MHNGLRGPASLLFISVILLLTLSAEVSAHPRVDPATGRIRMLLIGETFTQLPAISYMLSDPMLEVFLTGLALWTLMVKRRLYREVATTSGA